MRQLRAPVALSFFVSLSLSSPHPRALSALFLSCAASQVEVQIVACGCGNPLSAPLSSLHVQYKNTLASFHAARIENLSAQREICLPKCV